MGADLDILIPAYVNDAILRMIAQYQMCIALDSRTIYIQETSKLLDAALEI